MKKTINIEDLLKLLADSVTDAEQDNEKDNEKEPKKRTGNPVLDALEIGKEVNGAIEEMEASVKALVLRELLEPTFVVTAMISIEPRQKLLEATGRTGKLEGDVMMLISDLFDRYLKAYRAIGIIVAQTLRATSIVKGAEQQREELSHGVQVFTDQQRDLAGFLVKDGEEVFDKWTAKVEEMLKIR